MENYAEIILELMTRIQKLEKEVNDLKNYIEIRQNRSRDDLTPLDDNLYVFEGKKYTIPEMTLLLLKKYVEKKKEQLKNHEIEEFDFDAFVKFVNKRSSNKLILVNVNDNGVTEEDYFTSNEDLIIYNNEKYAVYRYVNHHGFVFIRMMCRHAYKDLEISVNNTRDTSRYAFNGKNDLKKSELVFEVIKYYAEQNPNITYEELVYNFPKSLQGSLGVVLSLKDVDEKYKNNPFEKRKRFFVDKPIYLKDSGIYVCSQWALSNIHNFIKRSRDLNLEISEFKANN